MIFLPQDVKDILNEQYNQQLKKPIVGIELPCTNNHKWKEKVIVQIYEARDQKIICPKCGKTSYVTWSKIRDNIKVK